MYVELTVLLYFAPLPLIEITLMTLNTSITFMETVETAQTCTDS